ncbi:hypothetical protein G4B88_022417 [Cannabis sativa]|uniref:Uncharacterized protein n=1 Tax=Cannabis sativa TaxID=3483 RepID=A0A7J6HVI5_CANSA|nr:hypothetical protein G4B88_022417 [Cannabis sativa]
MKVERCLRLLKSFLPESLDTKTLGCVDDDFEEEKANKGNPQFRRQYLCNREHEVNAFNFVNVVDALYYSKYFLTLTAVKCQHPKAYSVVKTVGTLVSSERDTEVKSFTVFLRIMCANITVVGDGRINEAVYKGLRRRVIGIAMQNPGILENDQRGVIGLLGIVHNDDRSNA